MPTRYRDYAGLFPNYQAVGNAKAQNYQNNANTVGQLLQALSAIAQKNQQDAQDKSLQEQFPIMQDKSFTVGDIPRPNTVVSTDLLGKPLTQTVNNTGYGGSPVSYQKPAPVDIPQMQGSVSVPPQFMLSNLFAQMTQGGNNPVTQARLNNVAKMPEIAKAFSNTTKEFDPTKDRTEFDWQGNHISTTTGTPKPIQPNVDYRTVMVNGKPKTIKQDGITFAEQEAYDKNTGKTLVGYQADVKKIDDGTYKPSMYDKAGNDEVKSLAQLVATYDADINSIPRQDRTQVFAEASKLNPKFSQANYTANKKLKENYTSGKYSQNIVSFNTAIGHLGDMVTAAEALKNNDIQLLNLLANEYGRQTGESAPDSYEAVRDAVANEMATALKGSSGTDIGLQNILKTMNSKQSPEQAISVARQFVNLLDSRLKALNANYKKQTGVDFPVLDEDKAKVIQKIIGNNNQIQTKSGKTYIIEEVQ